MSGFFTLDREALDHPMFAGNVNRLGAWSWLIGSAAWAPCKFDIKGKVIELNRGQLCVSIRQLANAWGWSRSAVDRFLTRLETETMISREAGHGRCVLTILNYSKYQDVRDVRRDSGAAEIGTRAGQQRDTKEQDKPDKPENPSSTTVETDTAREELFSDDEVMSEREKATDNEPEYAFRGEIIKLNSSDFAKWSKTYHGIMDLNAELDALDSYYAHRDPEGGKGWFHRTKQNLLRKHNDALIAERERERVRNKPHLTDEWGDPI